MKRNPLLGCSADAGGKPGDDASLRGFLLLLLLTAALPLQAQRPRARDIGIVIGALPTGPLNAITDVAGVRVGHATIARGDSIN
ncbi:MAG TPA: hypothetical protein VGU74_15745, partial [Gemmatimonadales bacterium]|nr:hypothetical protein [Gemmatimonadales bacterium]